LGSKTKIGIIAVVLALALGVVAAYAYDSSQKDKIAEGVRIHAPYTHVPYHERIDDGYPNFVNNDHCLLSARAATQLTKMVPEDCAALPLAQTIWYIPTGLDIWNQKIAKAPGHYARGFKMADGPPPVFISFGAGYPMIVRNSINDGRSVTALALAMASSIPTTFSPPSTRCTCQP